MAATNSLIPTAPSAGAAPAHFAARLHRELNPTTAIETLLTGEIARSAELLGDTDAAIEAFRSSGHDALASVLACDPGAPTANLAMASVVASDRYERLLRQRHGLSRGMLRGIHELAQLRDKPRDQSATGWQLDPRFATDAACVTHLGRRFIQGVTPCQHCGSRGAGTLIVARPCWQCSHCRAQTGLRQGTCMERSSLALRSWFAAIRATLLQPNVAVPELAAFLAIARTQTVAHMVRTIRRAITSPEPSRRLAGLDEIYLGAC